MRRILIPAALAAAFLLGDWPAALQSPTGGPSLIATAAAQGYDDGAYQEFYGAMAPYGRWVVTAQWGHVWSPGGVPRDWRPYTAGHWAYTDQYGWTWVSDYQWGWAPFHYGRWAFDPQLGWIWVPGRVWGPAWVSFRIGDGYIGWAPMPPQATGYDYSYYEPPVQPGWWSFVPSDRFDAPVIAPQLIVVQQNTKIIHVTKNVTNIKVVNDHGVNHSFDDRYVARYSHRPVAHYRPTEVSEDQWHKNPHQQQGNQLVVVRPPRNGNGHQQGNYQKPEDQARHQQPIQQQHANQQQDKLHQQELLKQQQIEQQHARQQQDKQHQQEELLKQQQIQQQQHARRQQDKQHQQELLKQQQIQQQHARQQQDKQHQQELLKQQAHRQDQVRRQQEAYRQQQSEEKHRQQNGNANDHNNKRDKNQPPKHDSCGKPGQGPC